MYRVDHDEGRGGFCQAGQHHLQPRLRQHEQVVADRIETLGPTFQLIGRLFCRDVQHGAATPGHACGSLQQQRALTHSGLAADQADRGTREAASQGAVQLADAGGQLRVAHLGHVANGPHRARHMRDRMVVQRRRQLLGQRVPITATPAPPGPLVRLVPAGQAAKDWRG